MIKITTRIPNISGSVQRAMPTGTDMADMALDSRSIILKRTTSGLDVNGAEFKEYSERYANAKAAAGRQTSRVDLTFHNRMLGSLAIKNIMNGAELYFADGERRIVAYKHQMGIGVPQREFFGLSEREMRQLADKLAQKIQQRLNYDK